MVARPLPQRSSRVSSYIEVENLYKLLFILPGGPVSQHSPLKATMGTETDSLLYRLPTEINWWDDKAQHPSWSPKLFRFFTEENYRLQFHPVSFEFKEFSGKTLIESTVWTSEGPIPWVTNPEGLLMLMTGLPNLEYCLGKKKAMMKRLLEVKMATTKIDHNKVWNQPSFSLVSLY